MRTSFRSVLLVLALAICVAATSASGATKYWTGDQDINWNTSNSGNTNWSSTLSPNNNTTQPTAGDDVIFHTSSGAANLSTNFNGTAYSLNSLRFNSSAVNPVTITTTNSNPLTLTGSTVLDVQAGDHTFAGTAAGSDQPDDWIFLGSSPYTLNVETGASFTIHGRIQERFTSDQYIKDGGGTLILSGNNGGSGAWLFSNSATGFTVSEGILRLSHNNATGNSGNDYVVASGATLELAANYGSQNGRLTLNGAGHDGIGALHSVSGNRVINVHTTFSPDGTEQVLLATDSTINVSAGTLTIHQDVNGAGGLTKIGVGDLILTNSANNYSGITNIEAGRLLVTGTLSSAAGAVNINDGGTLGGDGTINRHINLLDGGTHAVGNSIDFQTVASETWNGGGTFEVEIDDFDGIAGTNWDLLMVTGALTVAATTGNPVIIKLVSDSGDNFLGTQNYSNLLIASSTGLSGFDPSLFTFDVSEFDHDLAGGMFFVSTNDDNNVYLNFAAVPEPDSWALAFLACVSLACCLCVSRRHGRTTQS